MAEAPAAIVAFVGPSMPPEGVPAGIAVWPPAQRGDALRAMAAGARTLVVVDGLFHRVPAISHQELRYALATGVRVIGAASMGALRAAEMAALGMEPAGVVAAWYTCGALDADDEVALLHGPAPEHRALTVPLVEVRWALGWRPGAPVEPPVAGLIAELARSPYTARSRGTVAAAAARWLGDGAAAELVARLARPGVKQADARAAFAAALAPPARRASLAASAGEPAAAPGYLCAYLERYLTVPAGEPPGAAVALAEAWAVAALLHPQAPGWLAALHDRFARAAAALPRGRRAAAESVARLAAELAEAHRRRWGAPLLPAPEYAAEARLRLLAAAAADEATSPAQHAAAARAGAPWWTCRAFSFSPALAAAATTAAAASELRDCFRDWSRGRVAAAGAHRRLAATLWGCGEEDVPQAAAARGLGGAGGAALGLRQALDLLLVAERLPRPVNGYPAARERLRTSPLGEHEADAAAGLPVGAGSAPPRVAP